MRYIFGLVSLLGVLMLIATAVANTYAVFFLKDYSLGMGWASFFWIVIGWLLILGEIKYYEAHVHDRRG